MGKFDNKAAPLEKVRTGPAGMRYLPGGRFLMGSDRFYPEEAPARLVWVAGFWIDETPVTNAEFARFVDATGHRTLAEIAPDPAHYPGMSPAMARPGSLVFKRTAGPVDTTDPTQWWDYRFGADWRHPLGPESSLDGLADHPVVHVAVVDAQAYAAWAGKALPTEAEWEYAARGGLADADYAWGDELAPGGALMANYWQGLFPFANQLLDGWEHSSPVRTYPANGFGLWDLIGNVWEWTADPYTVPPRGKAQATGGCCDGPRRSRDALDHDDLKGRKAIPQRVMKGGSHLCAPNYCQRYRPAARHAQPIDSATSHIGFRCVVRDRPTRTTKRRHFQ